MIYSMIFLLFMAAALAAHEITGRFKSEYQWVIKLIASAAFYLYSAGWRVIFLLLSIISVWAIALKLDAMSENDKVHLAGSNYSKEEKKLYKKKRAGRKRLLLFCAIGFNLSLLVLVRFVMPRMLNDIVLPLGISFYTFMAISYLADVYGGKYQAEKNAAKVALYLSWFPQMLFGPINRFDYVKDTLFGSSRLNYERIRRCGILFLFGAIKKFALANFLSPCVNEIFGRESLSDLPGSFLLFTALLFAIEQYADFSGGIDMVMAISGLFAVKMNDNFRQPYFSKTLSEFWRRWHISLGAFLRDYVFYPFALLLPIEKLNKAVSRRFGKRFARSVVAGIGNILIFLLVGLWHGSDVHYIVWGLYFGVIIAVSDFLEPAFMRLKALLCINSDSKIFKAFQIARTFFIVVLAGYFDAITNVSNGIVCFKNTFFKFNIKELVPCIKYLYDCALIPDLGLIAALITLAIILTVSLLSEKQIDVTHTLMSKNIVFRWSVYFVLLYVMLFGFAASGNGGGFMYAAF